MGMYRDDVVNKESSTPILDRLTRIEATLKNHRSHIQAIHREEDAIRQMIGLPQIGIEEVE